MERTQNFFFNFFFIGPLPHLPSRHYRGGKTLNNNNASHLPAISRAALHRQLKARGQIPPSAPTGSDARAPLWALPARSQQPPPRRAFLFRKHNEGPEVLDVQRGKITAKARCGVFSS